jgi:very-short-patch-repair endonuclease
MMNNPRGNMKRREIIPYNPKLKELARKLRNNSTFTEIMLWNYLKKKQVRGYDFDRQKPIDNYIVDFYCKDLNLAIEVDGESHYGREEKDKLKDKRLKELGVRVLRFDDRDIIYKLDKVIESIEDWIDENITHLRQRRTSLNPFRWRGFYFLFIT